MLDLSLNAAQKMHVSEKYTFGSVENNKCCQNSKQIYLFMFKPHAKEKEPIKIPNALFVIIDLPNE